MKDVIPKRELMVLMERFLRDADRGISMDLFAELAGVSTDMIKGIFMRKEYPLTEYMQRRVSKAYQEWQNGHVRVMRNRYNERYVEYRKEPKIHYRRDYRLNLDNGQIGLKMGVVNRADYSRPTLAEQLES